MQLLQVVRGGQFPEIRTRSTVKALGRLAARGLMKPKTAAKLAEAYYFLRRVEHRIQFLDDQQTHCLPGNDEDLKWIARSLGLVCKPEACELFDRLLEAREIVATEFDALLHDGRPPGGGKNECKGCNGPALPVDSEEFLEKLQPELATAVRRWAQQPRVQALREESRLRLAKLVGRASKAVHEDVAGLDAALRFVDCGRAAAAARKLPGHAGRTPGRAGAPAAPAGPGALADALPDAAPRRDRRTGR